MLRPVKGVNAGWHGYCKLMGTSLSMFGGADLEQYISGMSSDDYSNLFNVQVNDLDRRDQSGPAMGVPQDLFGYGYRDFRTYRTSTGVSEAAAELAAEAARCLCR